MGHEGLGEYDPVSYQGTSVVPLADNLTDVEGYLDPAVDRKSVV